MRRAGLAQTATAIALAACAPADIPVQGLGGDVANPDPVLPALVQTPESQALAAYYDDVEQQLLTRGLLRIDGGGPDTPYSARDLARHFEVIALYEEYATAGGRIIARQTPSALHRWRDPITMAVHFGATVPETQRQTDRLATGNYLARLAHLTGHPMRLTRGPGNFDLFIVNDAERRALKPDLERLLPGISDAAVRAVTEMPRSTFCLVFAYDPADDGVYQQAVAVVRAEHPDLLRMSCLHEEIAQGLGLSNDSPQARPSIFNDDEEFATLTSMDELLLKMLFDQRLQPGMDPDTARPIVEMIAAELIPETLAMN